MAAHIQAENRGAMTKSGLKRLRHQGKIPGVIYGSSVGSSPVVVEEKTLMAVVRANPNAIIEMELPGGTSHPVMIHEVQRDKLQGHIVHIDFHQINMDDVVRATVRMELTGEPAGVKQGGVLQVISTELDIKCLPHEIPAHLQVDISHLQAGETMLVEHVRLPDNIEVLSDPGDGIATVLVPRKPEEEPAAEQEEAGQPAAQDEATGEARAES